MTHTPTCSQCGRAYTDGPCTAPRPLTLGDPAPVTVSTAPKAPPVPLRSGVFAARVRAALLATLVALGCKPNLPPYSVAVEAHDWLKTHARDAIVARRFA